MDELKLLPLNKDDAQGLPLLYNFIHFNELYDADEYFIPVFSEKYNSYIDFSKPGKLISKIIDFSAIDE